MMQRKNTTHIENSKNAGQNMRPEYSPSTAPTAREMADAMGLGLNLGNTMESYEAKNCGDVSYRWIPKAGNNTPGDYETLWHAPVTTQKIIDGIRSAGFRTVRIPVFWGNMMENDGFYRIHPDYMRRVREIVDYCLNAGLYTVINIHHFDEFLIRRHSLTDCERIFRILWTQIAEEFRDDPYTLVFEGYNEHLGLDQFDRNGVLTKFDPSDGYRFTNSLNQVFVDTVRACGGNNARRVLIASGLNTNIDRTTSNRFRMPSDRVTDRLMISVHYVDNAMYWDNKIGSAEWLEYIESQCLLLKNAFTDKGIPVFMGETTSFYPKDRLDSSAVYTDSADCLAIVLRKLIREHIVPVLWDTGNGFYSRTECQIRYAKERDLIKTLARGTRV